MEASLSTVSINGVTYVREDVAVASVKPQPGSRCVIVVDRGWIFAGDVSSEEDGKIRLTRAIHVFSWSSIGFNGVLENPKSSNVKLLPMKHDVVIPVASEIFRVPVSDDWGL